MERAEKFFRTGSSFGLALMLSACSGFPKTLDSVSSPTPEIVPTSTSVPIPVSKDVPTPTENPLYRQRDIRITNEAAIMRAATIRFLINGDRFGHGSIIQQENKYYFYTAEHVVDGLKNQFNTQVKIPGVGTYPLDPNKFYTWNRVQQESESGSFLQIQSDLERIVRFAVEERILQPVTLSRRRINLDEVIAIPREEMGVYTIYRFITFFPEDNRYFLRSPNPEATQICKGDSGSPALAIPITGEVFGVLVGVAPDRLKPETALSEKICADEVFVRPNG